MASFNKNYIKNNGGEKNMKNIKITKNVTKIKNINNKKDSKKIGEYTIVGGKRWN